MAKMTQPEARAEMEKIHGFLDARKRRIEGCTKDLLAVLAKWYPADDISCPSGTEAPEILAELIRYLNPNDPDCYEQCLNWVVDHGLQSLFAQAEGQAKFIYTWLTFHGHDEGNKFEFNDLDNHAFVISTAPMRVFCLTDQNCNYVMMLNEDKISTTFLVCRYWDRWEVKDKHDEQQAQNFKSGGIPYMLTQADWWTSRYSDNYPLFNRYGPHRPDLEWFKGKDFTDVGYGDCRDGHHVFVYKTLDGKPWNKDNHTVSRIRSIHNALFDIRATKESMEEQDGLTGRMLENVDERA